MSQEEQPHGHIEQYGNQRFKFMGTRIIAVEQTCFHCHQTYWQPVVSYAPSQMGSVHQCNPSSQAGANVIDKFG